MESVYASYRRYAKDGALTSLVGGYSEGRGETRDDAGSCAGLPAIRLTTRLPSAPPHTKSSLSINITTTSSTISANINAYRIDPVQSSSYLDVGVICEKDLVALYVSATRIRIDRGARLNPPGLMSLTNTSSPSMSTQPHVKSGH